MKYNVIFFISFIPLNFSNLKIFNNLEERCAFAIGEKNFFQKENCDGKESFCVSNSQEFITAINEKRDIIVLKSGSYDVGILNIDYPVIIKAATPKEANFVGESYLHLKADGIQIHSLSFFKGAKPSNLSFPQRFGSISVEGNNILIFNSYFNKVGFGSTVKDRTGIVISIRNSNNVEIKNNKFENIYGIAIKQDDFSYGTRVVHNDFLNSDNGLTKGEVFHIGDATSLKQGMSPNQDNSFSLFKHNKVIGWKLESELISIKSNYNYIEENLILDSGSSAFVVRMGNYNKVVNNIVLNNEKYPIRISGEGNVFFGNYFCGIGSLLALHYETIYEKSRSDLYNAYWAARDNYILKNTFIGYAAKYEEVLGNSLLGSYISSAPFNNYFSDNLIISDMKENNLNSSRALMLLNNSFIKQVRSCSFKEG